MKVAYNKAHVGDVLLVQLAMEAIVKTQMERTGDIAILKEEETGEIKAFNLFNASKYITLDVAGNVDVTPELVEKLEAAIKENGVEISLDVDFSPKFVVGFVESKEKLPNADKLSVCQVNLGEETVQIVCGAPNVEAGQKVVVAKVGAVMPSGLLIKAGNLRGEDSFGMICSARELAIPGAPEVKGILVLEDERLRNLMDIKLFVDTDSDLRIIRRIQRDIKERGRTADSVIDQYLTAVRPMHNMFIEPTKRYADVIIPEGGGNNVAIDLMVTKIKTILETDTNL